MAVSVSSSHAVSGSSAISAARTGVLRALRVVPTSSRAYPDHLGGPAWIQARTCGRHSAFGRLELKHNLRLPNQPKIVARDPFKCSGVVAEARCRSTPLFNLTQELAVFLFYRGKLTFEPPEAWESFG